MKKRILTHPYYLFIFPIFYTLYLYARNIGEINFIVVFRPMLFLCLVAGVLFGIFRLITKSSRSAAFLAFLWLIFLLFYGSLYLYLKSHPVFGLNLGHHTIIGVIWVVVFAVLTALIVARKIKLSANVIIFVNLFSVFLLLNSVYSIVKERKQFIFNAAGASESGLVLTGQEEWLKRVEQPLAATKGQKLPDIYYIIPDMFARSDAILDETGYDNTAFIQGLQYMGFYVAECSRSNYASTQLSIASALNLNYLNQIQGGMTDRPMLVEPMSDSLVRTSLEKIGYETVVFENGFGLPEMRDAKVTLAPETKFFLVEPYNPFESLIVNNSFLRVFYDVNFGPFSRFYDRVFFPYTQHVQAQKYIFDELPQLEKTQSPKFVFAHIMMPHPPFLIHADGTVETDSRYYREALGQPVSEELYLEGYRMQVEYVQNRVTEVVKEILAQSETEPIIIIQGDHGIRDGNRLNILNAYYVPEVVRKELYPNITPVNSFRALFDGLFGTSYGLLPDVSRYSVYPEWFDMQIETETNPGCVGK